jgi:Predicted GTPase
MSPTVDQPVAMVAEAVVLYLKLIQGLRTLMDFRYNQKFKADHGQNGGIKGMTGRGADDRVILVPQGTTVIDDETIW